mmetsp:Transcript_31388/g.61163  ORF Transcript_31388/g.61163 Transcript_31388/m.61163 type:complete len:649 (+) Transcript_31388:63-2009(+)
MEQETRTYSAHLTHEVEFVVTRVRHGLVEMKNCYNLLKSIYSLELESSKRCLRICEMERKAKDPKDNSLVDMFLDGGEEIQEATTGGEPASLERLLESSLKSGSQTWEAARLTIAADYNARHGLASGILNEVVTPLGNTLKQGETAFKTIWSRYKQSKQNVQDAAESVKKGMAKCQSLIQATQDAREAKTKEVPQENLSGGSWLLKSIGSKLQEVTGTTATDLLKKTHKAALQYSHDVEVANEVTEKFYSEVVPDILGALQELDRVRLRAWKNYIVKMASLQKTHGLPVAELVNQFLQKATQVDVDQEMISFVNRRLEKRDTQAIQSLMLARSTPLRYSLPVSPGDIAKGKLERHRTSPFHCTVNHCMSVQTDSYPGLNVPAIVLYLIKNVQEYGLKTEGIFRLTDEGKRLIELTEQLERGDYHTIPYTSPHVYAVMLKRWLRQLPTPCIPYVQYEDAIAIAREKRDQSAKDNSNEEKKADTTEQTEADASLVLSIFEKLPQTSQLILQHIAKLVHELIEPDHSETNRMTLNSLALLFSPCLMMSRSRSSSNAKLEAAFVQLLFQHIPRSDSLSQEQAAFAKLQTKQTELAAIQSKPKPTVSPQDAKQCSPSAQLSTASSADDPQPASTDAATPEIPQLSEGEVIEEL